MDRAGKWVLVVMLGTSHGRKIKKNYNSLNFFLCSDIHPDMISASFALISVTEAGSFGLTPLSNIVNINVGLAKTGNVHCTTDKAAEWIDNVCL